MPRTALFRDTFNGALVTTNLVDWTPTDLGSAWTLSAGASSRLFLVHTPGTLRFNRAEGFGVAYDDTNHAGGYVQFTLAPGFSGGNAYRVALRIVDQDNWVGYTISGTGVEGIRVTTCVGGVPDTTHHNFQGVAGSTYRIEDDGTHITFYADDVPVHRFTHYTDVPSTATGKGLIVVYNSSSSQIVLDDYESGTVTPETCKPVLPSRRIH
jgi:hypothetical protein